MSRAINVRRNVRLAPFTTLRVGGRAKAFVRASTEQNVVDALDHASDEGLDVFVLGGGSNVLVSDDGFNGLALKIALRGISITEATQGSVKITAGAGENWDDFVSDCVDRELAGVECLSGIPGFIGGTPIQNVGAYGQEVSETIESVRCFDRKKKSFVTLSNADCGFSYRTSIFNSTSRDRYIVVSVTFVFKQGGQPKIGYKDLLESFGTRQPTLSEVREAVLSIRRSKSMVIDNKDPNSRSAGSFFKNPVVEKDQFEELLTRFGAIPNFEFEDRIKIPAAWLIGRAGFEKGYVMGRAGISTKHNLALINRGRARATDIVSLQNEIRDAVREKFGIGLTPEPVFVGFGK